MGDAFYRWDGFSYYAPFSEFLPAVALAFILWTSVAVTVTVIFWLSFKLSSNICILFRQRIELDHFLVYIVFFVFLGTTVWAGKKTALPLLHLPPLVKFIVLLFVTLLSLVITRKFYESLSRALQVIHERITPLVWLFGSVVLLSIPLVSYHTWFKDTEKTATEKVAMPAEVGKNRPNIILVTFDAMTARDMSVYGYHRETTPFITEWAKSASVFTDVKAESTLTGPTTASIITGKRLWSHGLYHNESSIQRKKSENIALELKNKGYYTMMYSENSFASPELLDITEGFDDITLMLEGRDFLHNFHALLFYVFHGKIRLYDWLLLDDFYPTSMLMRHVYYPIYMPIYELFFSEKKMAFSKGHTLLDKFISDIDKNAPPEPFFVWIHLFPPHAPYVPPESFQGVFDPSPRLRTPHEHLETMRRLGRHKREDNITRNDLHDMETLRARYNELLLYCDKEFEDFVGSLETRNISKTSVIILSSDHGEIFGHKHVGHVKSPYEPVVHIPLIIKEPNQIEGNIFNDLVEQIDITATIMDFSGIPAPSWLEGRSLYPLISGKDLQPRPAFSMFFEGSRSRNQKITKGFISVYEGHYKLIYFIEENRSLLFNLKEDPDEMNNLFDKEPETGQRLLGMIKDNLERANKRIVRRQ
jgi:arylsulfatase A-like enzyme